MNKKGNTTSDKQYILSDKLFTWDESKNMANRRKHGITFEEATTVFDDPDAMYNFDTNHTDYDEERFLVMGMSEGRRVLMVCHCYRDNDTETRIISARRADKNEEAEYWR